VVRIGASYHFWAVSSCAAVMTRPTDRCTLKLNIFTISTSFTLCTYIL
jgi:hypothetical protein